MQQLKIPELSNIICEKEEFNPAPSMEIKQCLFTIKDMQEVITKKDNNEYLLLENAEMKQGKHFFPNFSCRQTAHLMRDQVKPTLLIMKN